jgi:endo-1,4-beta-D-glucanase Y
MPSRFRGPFLCLAALGLLALGCAKSPADGGTGAIAGGSGGTPDPGGTGGIPNSSGGTGGKAAGTGGAGPLTVMKPPSTYPQTAGATHPYPQGHAFAHCPLPAYNTDTVSTAYNNWKTKFFMVNRVVRPEMSNDTVSEGIAYGMLISVYMNDRTVFDALWGYAQGKFDGNGLMNWNIGAGGNVIGNGSATDADEDMAWALLMAGAQWGGPYNASALTLINNMWNHEVEGGSILKPGDNFGGASQTNPSYFAPSYYRVFAKVNSANNWMAVVDSSYTILAAASGTNGLVPNWANSSGAGVNGPGNDANGLYFGYDACRTPWRIALDYCENGETKAKTYLDKIVGFYAAQAPIGLGTIKDGYTTAGANPTGTLGDFAAGMSYFGPAGVAAMSGGHDAFLTLASQALASNTTEQGKINITGVFTYFQASWGVLSLLPMSGNFWNMLP